MMEAANTSETSVNLYQTKRRNIPEGSHLHTRRREILKSHLIPVDFQLVLNSGFYVLVTKCNSVRNWPVRKDNRHTSRSSEARQLCRRHWWRIWSCRHSGP
jgi:hypothetical protein